MLDYPTSYQDPGSPVSTSGGPPFAWQPMPYRMSSGKAGGSSTRRQGSRSHHPLSEGLPL